MPSIWFRFLQYLAASAYVSLAQYFSQILVPSERSYWSFREGFRCLLIRVQEMPVGIDDLLHRRM